MVYGKVQEMWRDFIAYKYAVHVSVLLTGVALYIGGTNGYAWYIASRERSAQIVMADAFKEYSDALHKLNNEKDANDQVVQQHIDDAMFALDAVLRNHKSSYLAPYAQAFKADLAIAKGYKKEGLVQLEQAVASMHENTPAYFLLKNKMALLRIDLGDVERGVKELDDLSGYYNNPHTDVSAFYLGSYYWAQGDIAKAKDAWQRIIALKEDSDFASAISPFSEIVAEKLQQIG